MAVSAQASPAAKTVGGELASVAKWVVPSVGALVAILGFVVESAHQSMLGVDFGDLGARAYLWSFGAFLRETIAAAANAPFLPDFLVFPGLQALLLLLASVLLAGVLLRPRLAERRAAPWWTDRPTWPLAALVVLAFLRLWYVDLPISRVENVLGRGSESMAQKLETAKLRSLETPLLEKARNYYGLIVCSRPHSKLPEAGIKCDASRSTHAAEITRLLLASVAWSVLFLLTLLHLRTAVGPAVNAFVLAPLAIHAALAPAYVYGKFVKSTVYDTALVQIKTDVDAMPVVKPMIDGKPADPRPDPKVKDPAKLLPAVLLSRDDRFLSLYVSQPIGCEPWGTVYQWVPWRVATGEVVVLREINPTDVIVLRGEQDLCPASQPPP